MAYTEIIGPRRGSRGGGFSKIRGMSGLDEEPVASGAKTHLGVS